MHPHGPRQGAAVIWLTVAGRSGGGCATEPSGNTASANESTASTTSEHKVTIFEVNARMSGKPRDLRNVFQDSGYRFSKGLTTGVEGKKDSGTCSDGNCHSFLKGGSSVKDRQDESAAKNRAGVAIDLISPNRPAHIFKRTLQTVEGPDGSRLGGK
jgi:hypothetical protein